jgi:uncharacterized membrane protein YfhO
VNGVDLSEVREFVKALDDPTLAEAHLTWNNPESAEIVSRGVARNQEISVQLNYASGWEASANGHALKVSKDGLGLLVIDPESEGECHIQLVYKPDAETKLARGLSAGTALLLAMWCGGHLYRRRFARLKEGAS